MKNQFMGRLSGGEVISCINNMAFGARNHKEDKKQIAYNSSNYAEWLEMYDFFKPSRIGKGGEYYFDISTVVRLGKELGLKYDRRTGLPEMQEAN